MFPVWSDTDQQWALSTQKPRGGGYNQIHVLSHIYFADVDPEVNVQFMDEEVTVIKHVKGELLTNLKKKVTERKPDTAAQQLKIKLVLFFF